MLAQIIPFPDEEERAVRAAGQFNFMPKPECAEICLFPERIVNTEKQGFHDAVAGWILGYLSGS